MKSQTVIASILVFGCILLVCAACLAVLVMFNLAGEGKPSLDIGLGSRVAVVDIEGVIWDAKQWSEQIKEYADNPRIKALVLNINSPGGGVAPSQELYEQIWKVRREQNKPVVSCFRSVAASGGYYIGCAANEIVSSPGCITGSIGVYMQFGNYEGLLEKIGVDFKTIQAGKFKTAGASDRTMTPEEEQMLQGMVDDIYEQFVQAVIAGRHDAVKRLHLDDDQVAEDALVTSGLVEEVTSDAVAAVADATDVLERYALRATTTFDVDARIRELADGRIYTGRQAQSLGLVDTLGHLDTAIKRAAEWAGIQGEPIVVHRTPRRESGFDFFSRIGSEVQARTEGTRPFVAYLMPFASGF